MWWHWIFDLPQNWHLISIMSENILSRFEICWRVFPRPSPHLQPATKGRFVKRQAKSNPTITAVSHSILLLTIFFPYEDESLVLNLMSFDQNMMAKLCMVWKTLCNSIQKGHTKLTPLYGRIHASFWRGSRLMLWKEKMSVVVLRILLCEIG